MTQDTEDLLLRLRTFNEWRRGADIDQLDTIQVGCDIDAVIALVERQDKVIVAMTANSHSSIGHSIRRFIDG